MVFYSVSPMGGGRGKAEMAESAGMAAVVLFHRG
jgi:hypothetical protein